MKHAADYREMARKMLKNAWVIMVALTLLASVLGGVSGGGGVSVGTNMGSQGGNTSQYDQVFSEEVSFSFSSGNDNVPAALPDNVILTVGNVLGVGLTSALGLILVVYAIIIFVIGGGVELGLKQAYIGLAYGEVPTVRTLFGRMSYMGKALGLRLMIALFTFLWTLLFIIPGIIAAYRYSMATYVMAENPDVGIMEAIRESKQLMQGNKWRLFCLEFSFIGWSLLAVLTCGIGTVVLQPYMLAAQTAFYLDISDTNGYDNRKIVMQTESIVQ